MSTPVDPRASPPTLSVSRHPAVQHKLALLRDRETEPKKFRELVREISWLLGYEALFDAQLAGVAVQTPLEQTQGAQLADRIGLIPILRAGLGMLDGMMRLLPTAEVGFLGLVRDETTLQASTYAERLPGDLSGRQCYVLDPMLATGGTLVAAARYLLDRGAESVTALCLLAAPEGIAHVEQALGSDAASVTLVVAGRDEGLNELGYIVPGLGDAGDRLFGLAE